VGAAVGIERAEQAVRGDRLAQADETRQGAFLVGQEGGIDRAGGVVEGDDQIEVAIERRDPTMGRAVLEQQHAGQGSALAPATMLAAPRRLLDQPGGLQRQPGDRVAQLVVAVGLELLVEMLRIEAPGSGRGRARACVPTPPRAPGAATLGPAAGRAARPPRPPRSTRAAGESADPTCRATRPPLPSSAGAPETAATPLRTASRKPPIAPSSAASRPPQNRPRPWRTAHALQMADN
jgi:hypothetical protein